MKELAHLALVLAPRGRDAEVAISLLRVADVAGKACPDVETLAANLHDDVCFILATEELFARSDLRLLAKWIDQQPSWSDLPIIILTHAGGGPERNPEAGRLTQVLRNVIFLERPFHPVTLTSVATTAIGSRKRQFEAKSLIQDLDENQQRLQTAILAGKLGTWELDLATMELHASATCKAAFGRRPEDPLSYPDLLASIHPDDLNRMQSAVRKTMFSGTDYAIEYRTIWPDGSAHWAAVHGRLVTGGIGMARIVGVSSDISDRKIFEQQLLTINASLERGVRERTADLEHAHAIAVGEVRQREKAEEQLLQAQKVEAIGQLTGGVAHDFNNLLMPILGNLELLRKHLNDDEKAIRLIEGALEGARRGAALTQRLLAFARRQELQIKTTNISALVRSLENLMKQSIGPAIELRIFAGDVPVLAEVDSNQIELALLNLVINAHDAMPEGGAIEVSVEPQIDVAEEPTLAEGPYIGISVTDTGKGMDANTLRRAVEPFFSTKGVGKGTGLGLSMIHGLALQLNGTLQLRSTPGEGTVARLLLPAVVGYTPVIAEPDEAAAAFAAKAAASSILVVDDDALIALSTAQMVEDLGHRTLEAGSGAEALEILRGGQQIDLMITDFSMPKMTGADLIVAARELLPDLPIVLASGYAELPGNVKLDVARLGKPYDQKQLADQINKALAR